MTINVGVFDRVARVAVGILLILFAWFYPSTPYSWIGWIGIVPLLTAAFGYCPLYSVLGVSTCPANLTRRS